MTATKAETQDGEKLTEIKRIRLSVKDCQRLKKMAIEDGMQPESYMIMVRRLIRAEARRRKFDEGE